MFLASRFLTILKFLLYCAFVQKLLWLPGLHHRLWRVGDSGPCSVSMAGARIWVRIRFLGSLCFNVVAMARVLLSRTAQGSKADCYFLAV